MGSGLSTDSAGNSSKYVGVTIYVGAGFCFDDNGECAVLDPCEATVTHSGACLPAGRRVLTCQANPPGTTPMTCDNPPQTSGGTGLETLSYDLTIDCGEEVEFVTFGAGLSASTTGTCSSCPE